MGKEFIIVSREAVEEGLAVLSEAMNEAIAAPGETAATQVDNQHAGSVSGDTYK